MQTVAIQTAQNVDIRYPVASLGDRILAYLIDWLILIAYTILIAFIMGSSGIGSQGIIILVLYAPWFLYHLLFELFMNGQSPGKRQLNIRVVKMNGTTPSTGSYLLRWIFRLIEANGLAVLVIAINGKGQRLGDMAAGTTVIKLTRASEINSAQIFTTDESGYTPVFPQAERLTDQDIEVIQHALEVNRDMGNSGPVQAAASRIQAHLNITTDMPPVKFLYTIIKDHSHYAGKTWDA